MRSLWLLVILLAGMPFAFAQQAQVQVSPGPYYVGVPIDIQVIAEGFEQSPEPDIEADVPTGAILQLQGVSPNISSSIQITNGRMTRHESVRFVYRYQLLARGPGPLQVGPFRVSQGAMTASADPVHFDLQEIPTASEQRFRLVFPAGPLWVGQRVPITLEWWLTESFAERLAGRRARVPLFDRVDRFKFEDEAVPEAKTTLMVDTASGTLELPVAVHREQWRGKPYLVVTARRTMTALKPGEVTVEPAYIVTEEAIRWSRDFFGNRVPAGVRRLSIKDEEHKIVFRSPPVDGRPASFSGAIGKGFTLEVSADRSVVQTGDPVRLTVSVRGDGALEAVSLPPLALSGLDAGEFKIPPGPVPGIIDDGVKRFELVLRVKDENVREIPPIALSWFNPELGQYETTHSRPIAVSVRAATVVSAADVVRTPGTEAGSEAGAGDAPGMEPAAAPPAFTLSGAELSIEMRPEVLRREAVPWYARPVALTAMYVGGLVVLAVAIVGRRRAGVDPKIRARRRDLEAQRRAVQRAQGVGDVTRALRRMAVAFPALPRDEYDALLVACDNLAYAPGAGEGAPVDPQLRARALSLADAILEGAR